MLYWCPGIKPGMSIVLITSMLGTNIPARTMRLGWLHHCWSLFRPSQCWGMRSLKAKGSLTRKWGMTKQQQSLSMSVCGELNRAMQELTGVSYNSGEQSKDIAQARQYLDWKDTWVTSKKRTLLYLTPVYEASVLEYMHITSLILTR